MYEYTGNLGLKFYIQHEETLLPTNFESWK